MDIFSWYKIFNIWKLIIKFFLRFFCEPRNRDLKVKMNNVSTGGHRRVKIIIKNISVFVTQTFPPNSTTQKYHLF